MATFERLCELLLLFRDFSPVCSFWPKTDSNYDYWEHLHNESVTQWNCSFFWGCCSDACNHCNLKYPVSLPWIDSQHCWQCLRSDNHSFSLWVYLCVNGGNNSIKILKFKGVNLFFFFILKCLSTQVAFIFVARCLSVLQTLWALSVPLMWICNLPEGIWLKRTFLCH